MPLGGDGAQAIVIIRPSDFFTREGCAMQSKTKETIRTLGSLASIAIGVMVFAANPYQLPQWAMAIIGVLAILVGVAVLLSDYKPWRWRVTRRKNSEDLRATLEEVGAQVEVLRSSLGRELDFNAVRNDALKIQSIIAKYSGSIPIVPDGPFGLEAATRYYRAVKEWIEIRLYGKPLE